MKSTKIIGMKKIKSVTTSQGRRGIIIFDSPINRIIIRNYNTVSIIDSNTFEKVKEFKTKGISYCSSKRSFNSFITPGNSTVQGYTIFPPYNDLKMEKEIVVKNLGSAYDIHAINEDRFITYHGGTVRVCSYNMEKVLKCVEVGDTMTWLKMILPSKSFENCVFLHQDRENRCIRLFDHEKCEIVRDFQIFKETKCSDDIMCMDSYMNKRNQEILIAGGKKYILVIYNLTEDRLLEELSLDYSRDYFSILCFGKYFLVGDETTTITLYESSESEFGESAGKSKKMIGPEKICGKSGWIMEAKLLKRIGNDARVVIISASGVVDLREFTGVFEDEIKDKQWKEDCSERKEFLVSHIDEYLPNEEEKKKALFSIKLKDNDFEGFSRILFL